MDFSRSRMDVHQKRVQQKRLKKLEKKEVYLLEKREPSFISRKVEETTAPMMEKIRGKLPTAAEKSLEKTADLLEKAFRKSFDTVLEKGSGFIGKLCSEQKRLQEYEDFMQKPLSGWELSRLGCVVAMRASMNMVFSSVQGGAMGALGIGLPDVPIFLGAVFKTLFEIALSFGYPYDLPQEQIYQMLLICAAVGDDGERASRDADRVAREIRMGVEVSVSREEAKERAAKALCSAALAGKLVQGTPVIGIYGGFCNGVLLKKIGALAAVKYQQRMLREL